MDGDGTSNTTEARERKKEYLRSYSKRRRIDGTSYTAEARERKNEYMKEYMRAYTHFFDHCFVIKT
jgi:hypothetical protein